MPRGREPAPAEAPTEATRMWRWAWGRCWQRPAVAVWPTTELGGCDCRSRRTVLSPKVNHKTSEWECDRARREVDTTRGGVKGPPPLGGGEHASGCTGNLCLVRQKPDFTLPLLGSCACWLLSRVTPCDPMGCSPAGSSVPGVLQARILEWVAISFSRGSS